MSYPISNIIPLTANISPQGLGTANFASAMIFAPATEMPSGAVSGTFRTYGSLPALAVDFKSTTETYLMGAKWLTGTPATNFVKVWFRATADDMVASLTAASKKTWWYWTFFDQKSLADNPQVQLAAAYCDANGQFFVNSQTGSSATSIRSNSASNVAKALTSLGYRRCFTVAHATDPYAGIALAKQFASVDYTGTKTVITGEYKKSPGVAAEDLDLTSMTNMKLDTNKCVFYSVVDQQGSTDVGRWLNTMSHSAYGEEIADVVSLDAFINAARVAGYNAIANAVTKLPQDPVGQATILGTFRATGAQFISNGFLGPRNYTSPDDGQIKYTAGFEMLTTANDILNLTDSQRSAHQAYPVNVRLFKAGSIWTVDLTVNVY